MADVILKDAVLDGGLEVLNTLANAIWVCAGTPADYTDAQTKELGFKTFGVGSVFGNPATGSPDGRQITSFAVTDGTVNNSGTVTCWAVVDIPNTTLLAVGNLTGGMAVTAGWAWTLDAFTIHAPATVGSSGLDAATDLWVDAVVTAGGTISDAQKGYVDELIVGLKADGLFALAEGLWIFAGEGVEEQAQIDIVNLHVGTTVGGLVYGVQGIYDGGSSNSAFNTGITSGSNFTTNSASVGSVMIGGFAATTSSPADNSTQFAAVATYQSYLRLTGSNLNSRLNTGGTDHSSSTTPPLNSPAQGVFMMSRTSSTAMAAYRDGTQLDTWSATATGVPTATSAFLARNLGGGTFDTFCDASVKLSAVWLGAGLDATQAAAFNTRICAYLAHYDFIPTVVNHFAKSQEFDNAAWTKGGASVTANDTTAPNGTTTADLVYATSSGSLAAYVRQTSLGDFIQTHFATSIYVKANNWTWIMFRMFDGTSNSNTWFNVTTGAVGTTGSSVTATFSTDEGGGWFRIGIAYTAAGGTSPYGEFFLVDADGSTTVTNSGTNGVWMWGAQVVYGDLPLSYSRGF